ncbi:putative transcription factor B3-Domain family [Helianthus annuus]|uniref:Transcription factor B3-Domain family n=1 Tax=Helianthus annuus TaxID=4232 RepID=A0A9K3H1N9_HELAN|nr:putative transcription factor B3-Domain family [Helianthus annuus]
MADEFWRQFYGQNFKGGQSTLYLGDRFWNVKMDGLTDSCVFTHGCSEMINDLALERRSTFVFSLHGNKIFEISVFNHQTGTQIQNNRVELVVLDDSIYGDDDDDFFIASEHKEKCSSDGTDFQEGVVVECEDGKFQLASFEAVFNDIDDSKFDNFFSSLLEMEDLKKKDDPKAKTIAGVEKNLSLKGFFPDKSKFETDLDKFLIPKNKSHVDPTGKPNKYLKDLKNVILKCHIDFQRHGFWVSVNGTFILEWDEGRAIAEQFLTTMTDAKIFIYTGLSEHKEKCSSDGTDFQEGVVVECEDDKFQLASFEAVFNDIDDSKFDNFFSSLLEMEDLKKKDKSKFETDLDKFLIPKNKSHVDPTGKTNVVFSEPSLCSTFVSDAIPKYTVDVAQSVLPRKRKV